MTCAAAPLGILLHWDNCSLLGVGRCEANGDGCALCVELVVWRDGREAWHDVKPRVVSAAAAMTRLPASALPPCTPHWHSFAHSSTPLAHCHDQRLDCVPWLMPGALGVLCNRTHRGWHRWHRRLGLLTRRQVWDSQAVTCVDPVTATMCKRTNHARETRQGVQNTKLAP